MKLRGLRRLGIRFQPPGVRRFIQSSSCKRKSLNGSVGGLRFETESVKLEKKRGGHERNSFVPINKRVVLRQSERVACSQLEKSRRPISDKVQRPPKSRIEQALISNSV